MWSACDAGNTKQSMANCYSLSNMSKLDFAFTVKQLSACVKRGRGCQHVVRAHLAGEWFSSLDEHLFVQAFELHVCTGV